MSLRRVVLLMAIATGSAVAALTTITDTIYRADGSPAQGSFNVQWQSFRNAAGQLIPAGTIRNVPIISGVFTVSLEPNVGATPSGTSYRISYSINGSPNQQYQWYVPVSNTPVGLNGVQFPIPGLVGQTAIVNPAQLLQAGATINQALCWNGAYWAPGSCGGGGGSAFPALTGGTNTTAAMVVGSGASLDVTGSGSINATKVIGTSITGLSGSGGKLLETTGTLPNGNLLSATGGNAVDSGIPLSTVLTTGSLIACGQLPAFTGDVTKTSGTCATTVTKTNGVAFGTAATANTGTSGHTLPFLDGNNTWTGVQAFNGISFGPSIYLDGNAVNLFQRGTFGTSTILASNQLGELTVGPGNALVNVATNFSVYGYANLGGSSLTRPNHTGLGSPAGRDYCADIGDTYFQTDAPIAGQNIWGCTATGSPGTWTLQGGPGSGTVTNTSGALAAGGLVIGNSGADVKVLGALGTSTTVLHGNSGGNPSFGAVNLATDVSGILPGSNGGLGTASIIFSGPSGGAKTFTLPNASSIVLTSNAAVTMAQGGNGADFSAVAKGGLLVGASAGALTLKAVGSDGQVLTADAASTGGVKWAAVVGTGTVTSIATTSPITGGTITTTGTIACPTCVTAASALTANALVIGSGSQASQVLGNLGTTSTVLHGNSGGAPSFGAVVLTSDVSGALPVANGGTGLASGTSGGVPYFSGTTTIASSAALTQHGVMLGGGAGAAPTALSSLGTSGYVLTSNGAGVDPSWQVGGAGGSGSMILCTGANIGGGAGTYYWKLDADSMDAVNTSEAQVQHPVPFNLTLSNFYVRLPFTAVNTNGTVVATVRKNGVDTALTVTVPTSSGTGTIVSDTTHSVSFAAGDLVDVKVVIANTNNASMFWTMKQI